MSRGSRLAFGVMVCALLVACEQPTEPTPVPSELLVAGKAMVQNDRIPISLAVSIPCALGGVGELAVLQGYLHLKTAMTVDATGGLHMTTHAQPMGISGRGLTSGNRYQATGITRSQVNAKGLPFATTFVNNFRIIGQRKGNNLLIHMNTHLTINANGEVTAQVSNSRVQCK